MSDTPNRMAGLPDTPPHDGPPYQIGRDFYLGERVDLTSCDCEQCAEFRRKFQAAIKEQGRG